MLRHAFIKSVLKPFQNTTTRHQNINSYKRLLSTCSFSRRSDQPQLSQLSTQQYSSSRSSSSSSSSSSLHSSIAWSAKTIIEANLNPERRQLYIRWNDDDETYYPYIWLLANCQCPACYNTTVQRTSQFKYLLRDNPPVDVQIDTKRQKVLLKWKDDHQAEYSYEWLRARTFRPAEQLAKAQWNGRSPKLWDAAIRNNLPLFDYKKMMKEDLELYNWLTAMEETGIAIIKDARSERGEDRTLEDIANRVAYLKRSNYGEIFTVRTSATPTNLAYTDSMLELHTDFPYYDYIPGIQLLHCCTDAEDGGESQLVDGFAAAYQLKKANLEYFRLLSTYPFDNFDIGNDVTTYHLMASHCAIK